MGRDQEISGAPPLELLVVEAVREHNVLPLTGCCNLSCLFCSHRFNPPGTCAYGFPALADNYLAGLMPCLDGSKKIILGESATRLREGEPLSHPRFLEIFKKLRFFHPSALIQLTTNGSLLNEKMIDELACLGPLEVVLSLNSSTARGRGLLMKDGNPAVALGAPGLLTKRGIPFHGSMVTLPHLVGYEDMVQTWKFLALAGARTVRLLLPGFTRITPERLHPPPATVEKILLKVEEFRNRLSAPLLVEPGQIDNLEPLVEGVIPGTAAHGAGLAAGDLITTVDGIRPLTRVDAFRLANKKINPTVSVLRNGQYLTFSLEKKAREPSGLAMAYDLDPVQVERVRGRLAGEGETLALLSQPALERWRRAREVFKLDSLRLQYVRSHYFGGSISCAGLLTVADFQAALNNVEHPEQYAGLLLPAAAFDSRGIDLRGVHYLSLDAGRIKPELVY